MIATIKKLELEVSSRPIHVRISYRYQRFSTFTIFAANVFPSLRQVGIVLFGFYFVLGQCMPIKSSPLTDEERAMLVDD
jgi:hypothetical protein